MIFKEILRIRDFELTDKVKLIRHQDKEYDLEEIYSKGHINLYQSSQSTDVFGKCEYIISFIGVENTKAKFVGVFKVVGCNKLDMYNKPNDSMYPKEFEGLRYYYDLEEINILDDMKERLIIDWGKSTRAWHQWLHKNEKEVLEILPIGSYNDFPGFLDFTLTYNEMIKILKYSDSNREWHTMLKSVSGIYMILDKDDGKQYIGSAYGKDGILGRWMNYASNGHGGNKMLKEILDENPIRKEKFQYTILQTLPKTLTDKEVIEYENKYKSKLGSRAFGLNSN